MNATPDNSKKPLVMVWLALLALLFMTWFLARFDFGAANTLIALFIAGVKMMLVILIFMQVRWHSKSVWIFAAAGFFWFLIMVTLTLSDYVTRGQVRSSAPPAPQYQPLPQIK